ncbi:MAG: cyclase family protein [Saprospiraceae bacterium]|nr:cyclase family protein [Saprospiraceae bacterium]
MFDLDRYILHDLTQTFDASVSGYSDSPAKILEHDGWNAKWFRIYSHAGTHMDAPHHFGVTDQTIEQFSLQDLMGVAHICRIKINEKQQLIGVSDLAPLEDIIKSGDSLLFQTGWNHKIGQSSFRDDLPRISEELARWCVVRKIKMLGVEAPSVADVNNLAEVTQIHQILLGGDVIIIEGLKNLGLIKRDLVFLMALPLKIEHGDGAPARVIAFEEKDS